MTRSDDQSGPIFLFGVGRCGSTAMQLHLSALSNVWIWGEHGGILTGLFEWGEKVRSHEELKKFSFDRPETNVSAFALDPTGAHPTRAAWLNGFREEDVARVEAEAIESLMKANLPPGKTRWGFKEIQYGFEDQIPERLLELFPSSKIVHTVRHPFRTVESSICEWRMSDLRAAVDAANYDEVDLLYHYFLNRWVVTTSYLADLERKHPDRIVTSKLETFRDTRRSLLNFLQIDAPADAELAHVYRGSEIRVQNNADYINALIARRPGFVEMVRDAAAAVGYDIGGNR